ncbi:hypothetical protein [Enterococcus entomosocium]|uniref:hypothetical protein n=1 Tax=Enterococcus entomosocium TaxID=3034352 RepID=UPI003B595E7E
MKEKELFEKSWGIASSAQRVRYNKLVSAYPFINWTYREKKLLLWLCQMDIDTLKTFEIIFKKLTNSKK